MSLAVVTAATTKAMEPSMRGSNAAVFVVVERSGPLLAAVAVWESLFYLKNDRNKPFHPRIRMLMSWDGGTLYLFLRDKEEEYTILGSPRPHDALFNAHNTTESVFVYDYQ